MANISAKKTVSELHKHTDPKKAAFFPKFFKTAKGEYGEGDIFIGVTVPHIRAVAKNFMALSLSEVGKLIKSKIHEERLVALFILTYQFEKGDEKAKKDIYMFYLKNRKHINNWDLVDASSYKIVGQYLLNRDRDMLYKLAKSDLIWDRRIAIVSTLAFIRQSDLKDAFKLSEMLLGDNEDLIHKASGWMLREAGKKDTKALEKFLGKHHNKMPRTMLRYAIEILPEKKRQMFLKGKRG
jgi:3-methyladenine DNA glycosylase AlkD